MNSHYLQTFAVLLYRDLGPILKHLKSRLIDSAVLVGAQLLAFTQFLPLLGMPRSMIAPAFIGIITQIFFSVGYSLAFKHISDLQHTRFIEYQLSLPLPKKWLFAQYIVICMLELLLVSLPLLVLGLLFLSDLFSLVHIKFFSLLIVYLYSLFFFALLFLYLAYSSNYLWFLDNIWARRLAPLFLLGCGFVSWKLVYAFSPVFGILLLCNPIVYVNEALRSSLLDSTHYLPLWICLAAITFFCVILCILFARAVKNRIDPI